MGTNMIIGPCVGSITQGALLNQIPAKELATLWLDGTILEDEGDYYFVDKIAGNNVLINDYDFPDGWVKGFPYKSAATIDIFGQTGVPVVSLFQNFDYADQFFCKHVAQVVDGNGVETAEAYVSEIVAYSEALTGDDLAEAITYFSVPTESATAVWVSKTGNDTTGNGTKALPYLTINKAITEAASAGIVYVRSGSYLENHTGSTGYVNFSKAITVISIGLCIVTTGDTTNGFYNNQAGIVYSSGFKFSGNKTNWIFNNNTMHITKMWGNVNSRLINSAGLTVNDCVIVSAGDALMKRVGAALMTITNSYIYGKNAVRGNSSGVLKVDVKNSTIDSSEIAIYADGTNTINVLGCKVKSVREPLYIAPASTGAISIKHSLVKRTTNYSSNICSTVGALLASMELDNCVFETERTTLIFLQNNLAAKITNCKLIGSAGKNVIINVSTLTIATVFDVSNNSIKTVDALASAISIGTEDVSGRDLMSGTVKNNRIVCNNYLAQHVIPVFYQKVADILFNYIYGGALGIVLKHSSVDCSNINALNNVLVNCDQAFTIKGVPGAKINNNTVINKASATKLIYILDNTDAGVNKNNDGIQFKNNIVIDETNNINGIIVFEGTSINMEIDYNIYYSPLEKPFKAGGTNLTFAEWQALGHDAHSVMLTTFAAAKALFIDYDNGNYALATGSAAIGAGDSLDATYDYGLDASTAWGDDTVLPVIVTKQQAAAWDCGAYVH